MALLHVALLLLAALMVTDAYMDASGESKLFNSADLNVPFYSSYLSGSYGRVFDLDGAAEPTEEVVVYGSLQDCCKSSNWVNRVFSKSSSGRYVQDDDFAVGNFFNVPMVLRAFAPIIDAATAAAAAPPDIVGCDESSHLQMLVSHGSLKFSIAVVPIALCTGLSVADVDGDGLVEILPTVSFGTMTDVPTIFRRLQNGTLFALPQQRSE